jgi:hypothetical protein
MIDLQLGSRLMRDLGIVYHPQAPNLLAHVYFALSEAYKGGFLYPDRRTDPTKIAAITCAAISGVRPLHAPTAAVEREEYIYVNQMLAMRCACGIVDHPVHTRGFDEQRRIYMMLQRIALPSIEPIVDEAVSNNGLITSDFQIKLTSAEEFNLKALINLFVVYKDLKIYQTNPPSQ